MQGNTSFYHSKTDTPSSLIRAYNSALARLHPVQTLLQPEQMVSNELAREVID